MMTALDLLGIAYRAKTSQRIHLEMRKASVQRANAILAEEQRRYDEAAAAYDTLEAKINSAGGGIKAVTKDRRSGVPCIPYVVQTLAKGRKSCSFWPCFRLIQTDVGYNVWQPYSTTQSMDVRRVPCQCRRSGALAPSRFRSPLPVACSLGIYHKILDGVGSRAQYYILVKSVAIARS
jgi:hypothetical protein